MISVFICEDDFMYLKRISDCIEKLILIDELELKLEMSVSDPAEIIQFYRKQKNRWLVFFGYRA